jgi:cbb3-type cytochrome c oxidase subunit III
MTLKHWTIIGLLATVVLTIILPLYALAEADRMASAQTQLLYDAVERGEQTYAQNCVVCHGAAGEGISTYPSLDNEGVRQMAYEDLFKVIDRGRYGTAMAAWGVNEGGVLNDMEVDQLVALLQHGDWTSTAQTVNELGLAPPPVITVEITEEQLAELASLPHGEVIAAALPVYAANCTGCHGAQGEGTGVAPALNDPELRSNRTDEELRRAIENGVTGTLMAGWGNTLPPADIDNLIGLIRYFDEIPAGAIPQPELPPIASTDAEVIAAGEQLYNVACAQCHGSAGQGSPMAPALNVQSFLTETNDQAIKAIVANGVPDTRMPAWGGRLNDTELNALVSFLRSWEATAPAVADPARAGDQGGFVPGSGTGKGGGQGLGPPWLR